MINITRSRPFATSIIAGIVLATGMGVAFASLGGDRDPGPRTVLVGPAGAESPAAPAAPLPTAKMNRATTGPTAVPAPVRARQTPSHPLRKAHPMTSEPTNPTTDSAPTAPTADPAPAITPTDDSAVTVPVVRQGGKTPGAPCVGIVGGAGTYDENGVCVVGTN